MTRWMYRHRVVQAPDLIAIASEDGLPAVVGRGTDAFAAVRLMGFTATAPCDCALGK